MAQDKPKNGHEIYRWAQLIGTNIATLAAAYFLFKGQMAQVEQQTGATVSVRQTAEYQLLANRLAEQDKQIPLLQQQINRLNEDLAKVRMELVLSQAKSHDKVSVKKVLQTTIDQISMPMWFKNYGGKGGVMFIINRAYEDRFCVTRLKYEGTTDFELWPENIALVWKKNDQKVINTKRAQNFIEGVPGCLNDKTVNQQIVHKFYVNLFDGLDTVGGIITENN